jgi:hypothetical protein
MDSNLKNKLKVYSSLLTAVTGFSSIESNAQVVVTNVNYNGGFGTYNIDIDDNGVNDFAIHGINWGQNYGYIGNSLNIEFFGNNRMIIGPYSSGTYPVLLPASFLIDADANFDVVSNVWFGGSSYGSGVFGGGYRKNIAGSVGSWGPLGDKTGIFIGVEFDILGNTHYGWMKLDVSKRHNTWKLVSHGYETQPDTPIKVPNPLSVTDKETTFSLYYDESVINVLSDASLMNAKVDVVNMLGQTVANTVITSNTTSINNTFGSGIFIVRISDDKGKAITRKIKM